MILAVVSCWGLNLKNLWRRPFSTIREQPSRTAHRVPVNRDRWGANVSGVIISKSFDGIWGIYIDRGTWMEAGTVGNWADKYVSPPAFCRQETVRGIRDRERIEKRSTVTPVRDRRGLDPHGRGVPGRMTSLPWFAGRRPADRAASGTRPCWRSTRENRWRCPGTWRTRAWAAGPCGRCAPADTGRSCRPARRTRRRASRPRSGTAGTLSSVPWRRRPEVLRGRGGQRRVVVSRCGRRRWCRAIGVQSSRAASSRGCLRDRDVVTAVFVYRSRRRRWRTTDGRTLISVCHRVIAAPTAAVRNLRREGWSGARKLDRGNGRPNTRTSLSSMTVWLSNEWNPKWFGF